jgi:hypothetical protein
MVAVDGPNISIKNAGNFSDLPDRPNPLKTSRFNRTEATGIPMQEPASCSTCRTFSGKDG